VNAKSTKRERAKRNRGTRRSRRDRDASIDYSDIPPTSAEFWERAALVFPPTGKVAVSLRMDQDVVKWFREQGPRYQTRMNAVLRAYAQSQSGRRRYRAARREAR